MSIYFIQCGKNGPIKIGYTNKDVKERMAQLQTACPYELKLLWITDGGPEEEQTLHHNLKHENIRGEWFRPGNDVLRSIDDSENLFPIKLNHDKEMEIWESYNNRLFMTTPLGELTFDINTDEIHINPYLETVKIKINEWWNK